MGRKSLQKILETDDNPLSVKKLKIQDNYINANADILNAKLKGIGLRIKFLNEKEEIPSILEDTIVPLYINGYVIYDTPLNKPMYNKLFLAFNKYLREHSVIEGHKGQKEEIAWEYVFSLSEIKELNISEDVRNMLLKSTVEKYQGNEEEIVKIKGKRKKIKDNYTSTDEDIIEESNLDEVEDKDDKEFEDDEEENIEEEVE